MTAPALRLRSVLYVPAENDRALDRARDLAADAVILDLEDAVAPASKPQARSRVVELLRTGAYAGRFVAVRVNASSTAWYEEDLAAAVSAEPDAVLVPKVQAPGDVLAVERALEQAGLAQTRIWAMIETPAAVLRAVEIAAASERLSALVVGTNDLLAELHAEDLPGRAALATSLGLCVLAARAAGCQILDGVYNDVRDLSGFEAECVQGRALGFDGKTLIHPGQIELCNRVFSPSVTDIDHAREVIEAYDRASRSGIGVATLDGRLIENLHVEAARRVLSQAEQTRRQQ